MHPVRKLSNQTEKMEFLRMFDELTERLVSDG